MCLGLIWERGVGFKAEEKLRSNTKDDGCMYELKSYSRESKD